MGTNLLEVIVSLTILAISSAGSMALLLNTLVLFKEISNDEENLFAQRSEYERLYAGRYTD